VDKSLNISKVYKLFSIILHMSLVEKPLIKDYWSTNPVLQTTYDSKLMKRDRFVSIFSMLHITNNDKYVRKGKPGYSLYKIRSKLDQLDQHYIILGIILLLMKGCVGMCFSRKCTF